MPTKVPFSRLERWAVNGVRAALTRMCLTTYKFTPAIAWFDSSMTVCAVALEMSS
jgi:hypothetical protein